MNISYSHETDTTKYLNELRSYRTAIKTIIDTQDFSKPESAVATFGDELLHAGVERVTQPFAGVTDVVLIGIGGSNLGAIAVHEALRTPASPRLHVLDMVSDTLLTSVLGTLETVPLEQLAIIIISKSGTTTETVVNADVVVSALLARYGEAIYSWIIAIGNEASGLAQGLASKGAQTLGMHEAIGGRYSVFTAVGLVPLRLLGYDIDALMQGVRESISDAGEEQAAIGAAVLKTTLQAGTHTVNFFTFDQRLAFVGLWYRQLAAESLGKEFDRNDQRVTAGFIPIISTPVELHSIGQLYFSGFSNIYTDFVSVADSPVTQYVTEDSEVAPDLQGKSVSEIAYAIEGGVLAAYTDRQLPFRRTILPKVTEQFLGRLLGQRMLETMYLAELLNVNAFDQPNVELYKEKTRDILHG